MKKRFVVAVTSALPDQKERDEKFIEWIKQNNLGWWHWIGGTWLLVDSIGNMTAAKIRDELRSKATAGHRCLVLEIRSADDTWAGYGPNTPDKDMFKWIKDNWNS